MSLGSNSGPYPSSWTGPNPHFHHSPPKLIHVFFVWIHRKRQRSFDDLATDAADIGVDGLLDGAVEHDDGVAPLKSPFSFSKNISPLHDLPPSPPPKTPVYVLFCKPLLALLVIPQQAWRFQLPAWLSMPLATSTRLVSYRKGSPTLSKKYNENEKIEVAALPGPSPQQGSTNMPLFGRAHECKEYEH